MKRIAVMIGVVFLSLLWVIYSKLLDTYPDKTFLLLNTCIASFLMLAVIGLMVYGISRRV